MTHLPQNQELGLRGPESRSDIHRDASASRSKRWDAPHADTLKGSRHPNMKELRLSVGDGEWRIAFAFDPRRHGILLVGGTKSGMASARFYRRLIATADRATRPASSQLARRQEEIGMPVKFEDMMKELFTPKERAAIRPFWPTRIARHHMALRELRQSRRQTQVSIRPASGREAGPEHLASRKPRKSHASRPWPSTSMQWAGGCT